MHFITDEYNSSLLAPPTLFFYLFIWLCWVLVVTCDLSVAGCEIFPHQRRNLSPLRWERGILATGLPDESSVDPIYFCFSDLLAHFSIWLFILFLLIFNTSYSSFLSFLVWRQPFNFLLILFSLMFVMYPLIFW